MGLEVTKNCCTWASRRVMAESEQRKEALENYPNRGRIYLAPLNTNFRIKDVAHGTTEKLDQPEKNREVWNKSAESSVVEAKIIRTYRDGMGRVSWNGFFFLFLPFAVERTRSGATK